MSFYVKAPGRKPATCGIRPEKIRGRLATEKSFQPDRLRALARKRSGGKETRRKELEDLLDAKELKTEGDVIQSQRGPVKGRRPPARVGFGSHHTRSSVP